VQVLVPLLRATSANADAKQVRFESKNTSRPHVVDANTMFSGGALFVFGIILEFALVDAPIVARVKKR
jgi:hypothetical protein